MTTTGTDDTERLYREIKWQERTCIFIDNANLFHAIRFLHPPGSKEARHSRLDYLRLREFLADGRNTDARFYYNTTPPPDPKQENFKEANKAWIKAKKFQDGIKQLGYTMIGLPLRERVIVSGEQIQKEQGLDVEIVYDMAIYSRSLGYKVFILVAGDEDYARIVHRIRQETAMQVDVAFFGDACSNALKREASKFIDLCFHKNAIFRDYRTEFCSSLCST